MSLKTRCDFDLEYHVMCHVMQLATHTQRVKSNLLPRRPSPLSVILKRVLRQIEAAHAVNVMRLQTSWYTFSYTPPGYRQLQFTLHRIYIIKISRIWAAFKAITARKTCEMQLVNANYICTIWLQINYASQKATAVVAAAILTGVSNWIKSRPGNCTQCFRRFAPQLTAGGHQMGHP